MSPKDFGFLVEVGKGHTGVGEKSRDQEEGEFGKLPKLNVLILHLPLGGLSLLGNDLTGLSMAVDLYPM